MLSPLFYRPDLLVLFIPMVAIVVWGIVSIVKAIIRHQERMALIERGIHPDTLDSGLGSPGDAYGAEGYGHGDGSDGGR